jgi:hypothetical protein
MTLSLMDDSRHLMLRVMGTKASRDRLRQREQEFAAVIPHIRRGGKTFTPGTREYLAAIRMMAEMLSDDEARAIFGGWPPKKS